MRDESGRVIRWYVANTENEEGAKGPARSSSSAWTFQQACLPERLPRHASVRFDALYVPAESEALVGGDWYDAIDLPDGRVLLSCGDVAGHGLHASLGVGRLRQAIAFAALDRADPADVLARVNRVLRFARATVVTCAIAVFDPRDLSLAYALAGHPPPVVAYPSQAPTLLPYADAPPLGVIDDFETTSRSIRLEPGTIVVFYTDGLTEFARDIADGERRLLAATAHLMRGESIEGAADSIVRAVMGEAASADDIALLILECPTDTASQSAVRDSPPTHVKKWRFHCGDARTARASRKELVAFLAPLTESSDDLHTAELVLGEMLANTVEHAPGLVEITIDWSDDFPRLTAADSGPGMRVPHVLRTPDDLSESGRGLFLIGALARDLTIDSSPESGTRLCATLPLVKRRA